MRVSNIQGMREIGMQSQAMEGGVPWSSGSVEFGDGRLESLAGCWTRDKFH